ncbi:glycogen synthase GlgA [Sulfurospirillum sp. 1612]|uniref:glycogen synthase GlgA n=1 Tax=Sulfurospirillum sp. 1612 TaxID=3094835 RepID=UPI002F94E8D4
MSKDKLKVLFVAAEVVPFAKTGGLADVSGALPKALKKLGTEIIVVMPRYYKIDKSQLQALPGALGVPMGPIGELWCEVFTSFIPGSDVPIYFIDYEAYFGRSALYDEEGEAYEDNDNRFIFLSKAALQLSKKLSFQPDIVHANDWHTAILPILCQTRFYEDFANTASVLTIHNLQHQGEFFKGAMDVMEVGWEHFNPMEFQKYENVNFLRGGIATTDALTTVSEKYAQEIQTPEFGFGLEEHIRAHRGKLFGILNGVDYHEWNPSCDDHIAAYYDSDDMRGKALCKRDLQEYFGLKVDDNIPLIGFVGRFAEQKGLSMIAEAIRGLLDLDLQIVILGTGEKWAEFFFGEVAAKHRDKLGVHIGYSNTLAHKIEAGSDMFLMPSLFEPCGLNQIYSLRYGTLPIVRATGGLDDTIINYENDNPNSNGFKFYEPSAWALYHTIKWTLEVYHNEKSEFFQMQQRAMALRFDWEKAALSYMKVYQFARDKHNN